jgi:hypothetical protein
MTARPLLVGAIVAYAAVLISVAATMSFCAGSTALGFVREQENLAPKALDPIPAMKKVTLPNIVMSNDGVVAPTSHPAASESDREKSTRFVAQFREGDKPYVVARSTNGDLSRAGVGDAVDGAVITRIGGGRVTLDAAGILRTSVIQADAPPPAP